MKYKEDWTSKSSNHILSRCWVESIVAFDTSLYLSLKRLTPPRYINLLAILHPLRYSWSSSLVSYCARVSHAKFCALDPLIVETYRAVLLATFASLGEPGPRKFYRWVLLGGLLIGISIVVNYTCLHLLFTGRWIVRVKCGTVWPTITLCISQGEKRLIYLFSYLLQFVNDLI